MLVSIRSRTGKFSFRVFPYVLRLPRTEHFLQLNSQPAIDCQRVPSDKGRFFRAQEGDPVRNIVRCSSTPQRVLVGEECVTGGILFPHFRETLTDDVTRRYCVYPDSVRSEVCRHLTGHADNSGLTSFVHEHRRLLEEAVHGGKVDDVAPAVRSHVRYSVLGSQVKSF